MREVSGRRESLGACVVRGLGPLCSDFHHLLNFSPPPALPAIKAQQLPFIILLGGFADPSTACCARRFSPRKTRAACSQSSPALAAKRGSAKRPAFHEFESIAAAYYNLSINLCKLYSLYGYASISSRQFRLRHKRREQISQADWEGE